MKTSINKFILGSVLLTASVSACVNEDMTSSGDKVAVQISASTAITRAVDNTWGQNDVIGISMLKAEIKDSYTTGGSITVNTKDVATQAAYEFASVGAFGGTLANGSFTNCYSNIKNISGYVKDGNGSSKNIAAGFINLLAADKLPQGATTTVTSCFSQLTDANTTAFGDEWPNWPLFKNDPDATNNSLSGQYSGNPWPCYKWEDSWKDMGTQSSVYPTLIWETPFTVENK